MPFLKINGARIYYEESGNGPDTIVFSHGLLWSSYMFRDQVAMLEDHYRCISYDHRGQGRSEVTQGGYDIESLYKDAIAVIESLNCAPCHFVGLSMGGFVGLRLGIRRSDLLKSLILIDSSSDPEEIKAIRRYRMLNFVARWFGLRIVADKVMQIMFGKKFMSDPGRANLQQEWKERMVANDRIGITRAVSGVIKRLGVTDQLDQIKIPSLIIVGDQDVALLPEKAKKMQADIPNSKLVIISGAGHTSTVEEPEAVTATILEFLKSQTS